MEATVIEGRRAMERRAVKWVGVVLAVVVGLGSAPTSGRAEGEESRGLTVSPRFQRDLQRAHDFLGEQELEAAADILESLKHRRRMNDHERALTWQTLGYLHSGQEDYEKAAEAFAHAVELNAMPQATQASTMYNLAQVYIMSGRYGSAIETLEAWFEIAADPGPDAYYLLGMAYVQAERVEEALTPVRKAVELSDSPKESWLQMLLSLYFQSNRYEKSAEVLQELVTRYPSKTYWKQLSAVLGELGREKDSLAVLQLAWEQGYLNEDEEIRNLVLLLLFNDLPFAAARIMEKALAEGAVEKDPQSLEMLANAYIFSKDLEKAVEPLQTAAEMSDNGDLYVRLAQVHAERHQWPDAEEAVKTGLGKGELSDPGTAQLLAGIASYNNQDLENAQRALDRAASFEKTRAAASQWLRLLEGETARQG